VCVTEWGHVSVDVGERVCVCVVVFDERDSIALCTYKYLFTYAHASKRRPAYLSQTPTRAHYWRLCLVCMCAGGDR